MLDVRREERKFLLTLAEYRVLRNRLARVLAPDPHAGADGCYLVRSLYYDTPFSEDFYDKVNGVDVRRKIRLRCYDPAAASAMLEMKQTQGADRRKRGLVLSRADALAVGRGELSPLLHQEDAALAAEFYGLMQTRCYRPAVVLEYRREAFFARENHTRITFDRCVSATESRLELFDPALSLSPVLDPGAVILEVKFDGFLLSYLKDILGTAAKSELSVSKYTLARQQSCLSQF